MPMSGCYKQASSKSITRSDPHLAILKTYKELLTDTPEASVCHWKLPVHFPFTCFQVKFATTLQMLMPSQVWTQGAFAAILYAENYIYESRRLSATVP